MKHSVGLLAVLALSVSAYATPEQDTFSRVEILDIFAQFNPSVLENAKQNPDYNAILEEFLNGYQVSKIPTNRFEIIAVARNFDNSIALKSLSNTYQPLWISARMSGTDNKIARQAFTQDVAEVLQRVWAVTVQLRKYQLSQDKEALKTLSKNDTLSKEEKIAEKARLQAQIKALKLEIKTLKKDPATQVQSAAEQYVSSVEAQLLGQEEAARQAAHKYASSAKQTSNLQVKTNHKKPVAK